MLRRHVFTRLVGVSALVLPLAALSLMQSPVQAVNAHANSRAVCPGPPSGYASCRALVVTDAQGRPLASTGPTGLSPAIIDSVYGFPTNGGSGQTIAIVDAYDDPSAASDLATFSNQFSLPSCTTANLCFTKVNQNGGTGLPSANSGWALEISLDIEWAHAVAPYAKILLVEASSASFTNLLTAETYASSQAHYVSNSWGASEFSGETAYDSYFSRSGVSFFVAAGDAGLPAEYPSSSPNVVSVGGTTLHFDSNGNFSGETGWSSGGGGCSAYENATTAQSGFSQYGQVNCAGKRATPDVSLDADPNSGVSVYDSTPYNGQSGWFTVGGTSASTPMWAAASADTGFVVNSAYVYGSAITYRDIISGNNGAPCLAGYDLCSGRGSWIFSSSAGTTTTSTSTSTSSSTTTTAPSSTSTTAPTTTTTAPSNGSMTVTVTEGTVSQKGPNYKVPLAVSVMDSSTKTGISGASVSLAVHSSSCSGPTVASGTGTTSGGSVTFTFSTKSTGTWCAIATATAPGYTPATSSGTTFTI
jgi:subtilase family serine protease